MSLTIELTPEEEARLQVVAHRQGIAPAECARRLLSEHLPPLAPGEATLALFAQWETEDATSDPAEIAERNQEWENLKVALNENRAMAGEEQLFP